MRRRSHGLPATVAPAQRDARLALSHRPRPHVRSRPLNLPAAHLVTLRPTAIDRTAGQPLATVTRATCHSPRPTARITGPTDRAATVGPAQHDARLAIRHRPVGHTVHRPHGLSAAQSWSAPHNVTYARR